MQHKKVVQRRYRGHHSQKSHLQIFYNEWKKFNVINRFSFSFKRKLKQLMIRILVVAGRMP